MKKKSDYLERQTWHHSNSNFLCVTCKTVFKQDKYRDCSDCKCPSCGNELVFIGIKTEVPRKKASNSIWKKFFKKENIDAPIV